MGKQSHATQARCNNLSNAGYGSARKRSRLLNVSDIHTTENSEIYINHIRIDPNTSYAILDHDLRIPLVNIINLHAHGPSDLCLKPITIEEIPDVDAVHSLDPLHSNEFEGLLFVPADPHKLQIFLTEFEAKKQ